MKSALVPFVVALVAITFLSLVEGKMRDRWTAGGIPAEELDRRFSRVPTKLGDWVGEDKPVDEVTRKTAGAISYVSRVYINERTQQTVTLWLVVGHARDICRHTPDICYPNQGFRRDGSQLTHSIPVAGKEQDASFYTALFVKEDPTGRHKERVFWAWNHDDFDCWEAPNSPRFHYGLSKTLYKVYFVSSVARDENTFESNVAVDFAEEMLPAINEALFSKEGAASDSAASDSAAELEEAEAS